MKSYEEILEEMTAVYESLSGFSPDRASDVGIRMKTLAYQVYSLGYSLAELEKQLFPQTAAGDYLDKHALQRGLERKAGTAASGKVTFTRNALAQGEILIPAGTVVSTGGEAPVLYETTDEVLLAAGADTVEADITAAQAGAKTNAAPLAVKLLITPVSGIAKVSNAAGIGGGSDEESDEELRSRLLESYRGISNGSNGAYYRQQALACPGIGHAAVLPRSRGRGTVDLVVYGEEGEPSEAVMTALCESLAASREVNVDLAVRAAEVRTPQITVQLACGQGYSVEKLEPLCRTALTGFLSSLTVGQPLYQSALTALLMGLEGVANCLVEVDGGDIYPLEDQIVRAGELTISAMAVVGG